MSKKNWFVVLSPLFCVWGLDRLSKIWAVGLTQDYNFGYLIISYVENPGIIFGLFAELPPVIRVVCLSTGGAFLIFVYWVFQILIPINSINLRVGLSILMAGILGNTTDRILNGYVIDFVSINTGQWISPVFNFADAVQWLGYLMILSAVFRKRSLFWPKNYTREKLWVNPKYQLKYCLILIGVGLGFSVISGTFSYTFLKISLTDWQTRSLLSVDKLLIVFTFTFIIISLIFSLILLMLGRKLSLKTVGPIYAFEKFVDNLIIGKNEPLRLREGDEFEHLELVAEKLTDNFDLKSEKSTRKLS